MSRQRDERGVSLVETLVALGLLSVVAAGVAQLFGLALASGRAAHDRTLMAALAAARLEQLRSLAWSIHVRADGTLDFLTDLATDLSRDPPTAGGTGLSDSPSATLASDVPGYVDYLDAEGRWVGAAAGIPGRAVYVRRWAVRRLPAVSGDAVALQVLVAPLSAERRRRSPTARLWAGDDVLLVTIVARRVR
jgi:type II secretory pathway pseudopilin PulG